MPNTIQILSNLGWTFYHIGRHMYFRDVKRDLYTANYLLAQFRH